MGMSAEAYRGQLQALLPGGRAWPRILGSAMARLLDIWGLELARVHGRGDVLLNECLPAATLELLPDWERVAGLPSPCMAAMEATLDVRRSALVGKLIQQGGASPAWYIAYAASLGYQIEITEYRAHSVMDDVGAPINGVAWNFAWRIDTIDSTVRLFSVESGANEPLASWGDALLICAMSRLKPAHTTLLWGVRNGRIGVDFVIGVTTL